MFVFRLSRIPASPISITTCLSHCAYPSGSPVRQTLRLWAASRRPSSPYSRRSFRMTCRVRRLYFTIQQFHLYYWLHTTQFIYFFKQFFSCSRKVHFFRKPSFDQVVWQAAVLFVTIRTLQKWSKPSWFSKTINNSTVIQNLGILIWEVEKHKNHLLPI